ncbi:MAG: hypothetical protein IEMM0006_1844 [bacterium]|nr:MAG: hypothetical protein IEMM0006_1844 [bacterium]
MKTIKMILVLFFTVATVKGFSQTSSARSASKFSLGVLGGLNIPRLRGGNNNEMSRDFTSRAGKVFGLTATLNLESNFALRVDVLYVGGGGKRNGIQAIDASSFNPQAPAGTYFYASYSNESILNYAEIPIMLKYSIPVSKSSKFYVDFGPYVGFLLNAKQKTRGSGPIYADRAETIPVVSTAQSFDAITSVTNDINPVNFGLTGGIGFTQGVGFGNVFLDIHSAYGLTIVQKSTQNGKSHNGNLSVALGYSIPL